MFGSDNNQQTTQPAQDQTDATTDDAVMSPPEPATDNNDAPKLDTTADESQSAPAVQDDDIVMPSMPASEDTSKDEPAAEPKNDDLPLPEPTAPTKDDDFGLPSIGNVTSSPSSFTPPAPQKGSDDLQELKQQALQALSPIVDQLEQTPEEKFNTTMMMVQATDNKELLSKAYEAAQSIPDEKIKAQALLDVVNEINFFSQPKN
jgi:hypothetical protein